MRLSWLPHRGREKTLMLDLAYVLAAMLFFLFCWAFVKACEKL